MAAKNIKTRNLTTSITKVLNGAVSDHNYALKGYEDNLKYKEVSTDFVKKSSNHDEFLATVQRQNQRASNNLNAHQKKYDEILADRLNMKSGNATEALLAETRATKSWARIERDLNGKDQKNRLSAIQHRLETAIKQGDHATVAAINSEAPHYLHSIGVKEPEQIIELILRTHDTELNQAHNDVVEAEKLRVLTIHNTSQVQKAFDTHINEGLKTNLDELDKIKLYVEPNDAIRDSIAEANDALRAAMEEAQANERSTDTSDARDEGFNPDAIETESDTAAEEPAIESNFHNADLSGPPNA
ncbi:hypothetical protein [Leucobacter salsicius]|uniref:hypothetical protein n=1 Tax=Leucobacter salsicius TaxID=664638 RepID=UPI000347EBEA|nr:hypothetical protein [Leucobacter salsicius]